MTRREEQLENYMQFIREIEALFDANIRRITTDPYKATNGTEFAIPINDLIIVDTHCGSKTILEHKNYTKYVIASKGTFVFNSVEYTTVCVVEEAPEKIPILYTILTDSTSLALHCDRSDTPLLPIGECNFIADPSNYHLVRYAKTANERLYIRQEDILNISSKLDVYTDGSHLIVTPKPKKKPPQ